MARLSRLSHVLMRASKTATKHWTACGINIMAVYICDVFGSETRVRRNKLHLLHVELTSTCQIS